MVTSTDPGHLFLVAIKVQRLKHLLQDNILSSFVRMSISLFELENHQHRLDVGTICYVQVVIRGTSPTQLHQRTTSEQYCREHLNDITAISGIDLVDKHRLIHLLQDINIRPKAVFFCVSHSHPSQWGCEHQHPVQWEMLTATSATSLSIHIMVRCTSTWHFAIMHPQHSDAHQKPSGFILGILLSHQSRDSSLILTSTSVGKTSLEASSERVEGTSSLS